MFKKSIIKIMVVVLVIAGALTMYSPSLADTHVPSAEILGLPPNVSCTGGSYDVPVDYQFVYYTNIVGYMAVEGIGVVDGYDQVSNRTDTGTYGLYATFNVPTGTKITVQLTTYYTIDGIGISYVSTLVFECGTGKLRSLVSIAKPRYHANNNGMIQISQAQAQPVYVSPNGEVVRTSDGEELWIPQDYDNNGSDTYLIQSLSEIDGRTWVEITLGELGEYVWVPLDQVTLLRVDESAALE